MGFSRVYNPVLHFDDINGRPLVGGSLYSFLAGTTTPATTYRDKNGHDANENPVPLNERGECTVWIPDGIEYKFLLLDSFGNVIWSADNVTTQDGGGSFVKKGGLHRIGVRMVQEGDPSPKPMTDWVIDLESPNPSEPDGYDRLTVAKAKEIHNNGEVFAFTSYATRGLASNEDTYYESIFNSSSSYLNIVLTKTSNHQNPTEISRAVISDFGDYLGVNDASADSEYLNVTLVQESGDSLKQNKIHRYSFGDATIGGETPVYGSWLIDLDKPDPNGPEGYARVTPADFWKSTAVNGEVPVYLQDKNANNSLTYAYLSRTDVTKSGNMVTNVFMYFVRSGYGNDLSCSNGFRFTKYPGSDYLQRASATEDLFTALNSTGDGSKVTVDFTEAVARANITTGEKLSVLFGKIKKWFTDLATVAFSGSYDDLSNKPTIPAAVTVDQTYNAASQNPQSGVALASHMIRPILLSNGPTGLSHTETFSSSVPQYFDWVSDNYNIIENALYIADFIVHTSGYKNTSVNIEIWAKKTTGKTWIGKLSVPLCRGIGYGQIILFRDNGIAFEFSVDIEPNDFSVGDEITIIPSFLIG